MPYDITGVKFVHWTWHDTDPNVADRHYWVPWNSYFFHLTFSASFTFWFHTSRKMIDPMPAKWQYSRMRTELTSMAIAALLGPLGGIILFTIIYHPLHDFGRIHSEVVFFITFSMCLLTVWTGQNITTKMETYFESFSPKLLQLALTIHYLVFLGLVSFGNPEGEVSEGLHQQTGPCNITKPVQTILKVLQKEEFLCPTNYDEGYFDLKCVNEDHVNNKTNWYTICGTPFENRVEYIAIMFTITVLAIGIFGNVYYIIRKCPCNRFNKKQK